MKNKSIVPLSSPNRRKILRYIAATGGALVVADSAPAKAHREAGSEKKRSLRVLILGGTGFIGPHFVRAALAQGHHVAVFNRGREGTELPSKVERLVGDRNGDFESIRKRDWDAVLDLSTYGPGWVRSLGEALRGRVGHYTFISSVNVYDHSVTDDEPIGENGKLVEYQGTVDPYSMTQPGKYYGELKVLCEREAERQFPGRTLILRPSYIVGPGESVGALTYWAARMRLGGTVLTAGNPLSPLHFIDVCDLTQWTMELVQQRMTGPFNAVGPAAPTSWGALLKTLRSLDAAPAKLVWVPESWLAKHKIVSPTDPLLFWNSGMSTGASGSNAGSAKFIANNKARTAGLTYRPLSDTINGVLTWYWAQGTQRRAALAVLAGLNSLDEAFARERALLASWQADAE